MSSPSVAERKLLASTVPCAAAPTLPAETRRRAIAAAAIATRVMVLVI
jgi:hypothetical protein